MKKKKPFFPSISYHDTITGPIFFFWFHYNHHHHHHHLLLSSLKRKIIIFVCLVLVENNKKNLTIVFFSSNIMKIFVWFWSWTNLEWFPWVNFCFLFCIGYDYENINFVLFCSSCKFNNKSFVRWLFRFYTDYLLTN